MFTNFNTRYLLQEDLILLKTTKHLKKMNIHSILNLLRHKKGVYNKAGNYYNKMNLYFVVPSILITTLSSIFAFLSTSDIIDKENQNIFIILVGIMSAISTMSQSISSSVGYGTRKEMFLNAADQYDKIILELMFIKNFDVNNNSEELNETIEKIKENITKIEDNCKYLPPNWIINEYEDNQINQQFNQRNNINQEIQPLLDNQ